MIGVAVKNLNCLKIKALTKPNIKPVRIEKKLRDKKLPIILNGVLPLNSLSGPANSITVLNRIMQTASFVIPSPNTRLNSLGY